jgi:hypothetical protein
MTHVSWAADGLRVSESTLGSNSIPRNATLPTLPSLPPALVKGNSNKTPALHRNDSE